MRSVMVCCAAMLCLWLNAQAQEVSTENLGASITLPELQAKISVGFNYDFLRSPTDVSFERPRGYFGFNLPLEQTINLRDFVRYMDPVADSIFTDSTLFTNGDEFRPKGSAKQNPNFSVMVDVPMMGGVASFSNIQNFYMNYQNVLGNPNLFISPDSLQEGLSFLLRGTVNVPLNLSMSWETMTFGYAYQVNPWLIFALNLHRHVFVMDLRAKIDADLLGRYSIDISQAAGAAGGGDENSLTGSLAPITGELDYPSEKVNGKALGHYETEVWSPTIGLKLWRFSLTSRFGINTKAHGYLLARYSLPFFLDPETFQTTIDFTSTDDLMSSEVQNSLMSNATDSIAYLTESDLIWKMPQGHTIQFDIVREKLNISYTKTFGEMQMKINNLHKERRAVETQSTRSDTVDSINLDMGVTVDHVMMLHAAFANSFINIGAFAMDFRYGDREHILGDAMAQVVRLGRAGLLPVMNLGTALGTRMQLLIEVDVLPLPAVKTGIIYHF